MADAAADDVQRRVERAGLAELIAANEAIHGPLTPEEIERAGREMSGSERRSRTSSSDRPRVCNVGRMKFLVRERIFDIGDDFWIEDENGDKAYLVDGKVLRIRDTMELKDLDGRVLITIKEKLISVRDTMTLERDGEPLATIRKKQLTLLHHHYRVKMADGTELDVTGNILDREFAIEYENELLADISKKWFTMRDAYAVNVVREDSDPALLIAVAVSVIHMLEKDKEKEGGHGE